MGVGVGGGSFGVVQNIARLGGVVTFQSPFSSKIMWIREENGLRAADNSAQLGR